MPVSPATAEHLAAGVVAHYQDAEAELTARIAKNLAKGLDAPTWAADKLAQLQEYERQARRLLADLEKKAATGVETAITEAYDRGGLSAVADIAKLKPGVPPVEPLAGLRAVEALTQETLGNVLATHPGILRSVMDTYRSVIAESSSGVLLGDQTRRQAAQAALNRFAQKGIKGFTDKAGRAWSMESYTEMTMRTGCGRAAVQGHVDRLTVNGLNLVIVSDAPKECPVCRPWEGKVLSIGAAPIEMPPETDPAFQVDSGVEVQETPRKPAVTIPATPVKTPKTPAPAKVPPKPVGKARTFADDAEGKQWLNDEYGGWRKGMTAKEDSGLAFYQSPGYELMNGQLRGTSLSASATDLKRARDASRNLKSAIAKAPVLKQDTTVFRGFSAGQFDLKAGAIVQDKAFVSTALTKKGVSAVNQYGEQAIATIRLPAGTRAAAGYTRELILAPESKFRIISAAKKGKAWNVEMELLP